ncbi:MAG: exodeoxyribonuclease VII small subunit [Actinomycetota bacterium]
MSNEDHDQADTLDLTYGEAVEELDRILAELEGSAVDVDVLADRVARGALLVRHCRDRLHTVRADVEAVVESLLDEPGATPVDLDDASDADGPAG